MNDDPTLQGLGLGDLHMHQLSTWYHRFGMSENYSHVFSVLYAGMAE